MRYPERKPDDVLSEDPGLWIIGRQEFDRAEPVRLILPVWLEIILAVRSQERQTSNSGLYVKTRGTSGTRTVQPKDAPLRY